MIRAEFNIDTACVDVYIHEYATKPKVSIYTPLIEDSLQMGMYARSQLKRLVYEHPSEYADMVMDGTISEYVALCNAESRSDLPIEYMMYDS